MTEDMQGHTKTERLMELFRQGKNPKEAQRIVRCSSRHSETVYDRYLEEIGKGAEKAQNERPEAKAAPSDGKASPSTSAAPTKPEQIPLSDLLEVQATPPPPAPASQPAAQPGAAAQPPPPPAMPSGMTADDIDMVNDAGQDLSAMPIEELRKMVMELYLYMHKLPAQLVGVPVTQAEEVQLSRLGRYIGARYIRDASQADLIFWGTILLTEAAFIACRFPTAMQKFKEFQAKNKELPASGPQAQQPPAAGK